MVTSHMDRLNPGIANLSEKVLLGPTTAVHPDLDTSTVDYAVIGPEAPLAAGLVDELESRHVPCVGPRKSVARIESSKSFARTLLTRVAPDANPVFHIAHDESEIRRALRDIGEDRVVVKPDGLTGGKGVRIAGEHLAGLDDELNYASGLVKRDGLVVIEERVHGTEFTVQAFVDGDRLCTMPLVRDFKRAYDGDRGPNTGSMGSYSMEDHVLPDVNHSDIAAATGIMERAISGIRNQTGEKYRGILYGQFMKTRSGVRLIEFNARFGDPEAINVLSIMRSSMDELCRSILDGDLKKAEFERLATVCVYLVPEGYPEGPIASDTPVTIETSISSEVYYASVYSRDGVTFTTSSRAIALLGRGKTVRDAREIVYRDINRVQGRLRYRTDIAAGL